MQILDVGDQALFQRPGHGGAGTRRLAGRDGDARQQHGGAGDDAMNAPTGRRRGGFGECAAPDGARGGGAPEAVVAIRRGQAHDQFSGHGSGLRGQGGAEHDGRGAGISAMV